MNIPGVATNTPPKSLKGAIDDSIQKYVAKTNGKDGLYAITTYNGGKLGTNLVVVKTFELENSLVKEIKITGYIGKTWGEPVEGGIELRIPL